MKKITVNVLIISILNLLVGCFPSSVKMKAKPPKGESVVINLKDGITVKGVLINREGNKINYIDADTHKSESVDIKNIKGIKASDKVYDYEGYVITTDQIRDAKGSSKKIIYSMGGLLLGTLLLWAVVAIPYELSVEESEQKNLLGLIVLFGGIPGAILGGIKGNAKDKKNAINSIRKDRIKNKQKEEQKN